jgi:hypothetical protein
MLIIGQLAAVDDCGLVKQPGRLEEARGSSLLSGGDAAIRHKKDIAVASKNGGCRWREHAPNVFVRTQGHDSIAKAEAPRLSFAEVTGAVGDPGNIAIGEGGYEIPMCRRVGFGAASSQHFDHREPMHLVDEPS